MTHPSRSFFAELLQATHQKSLPTGKTLQAQIIKTGSSSCTYIANSLVNLYAKCQHLPEAGLAFEEINNKDTVSWNCLISGHSQQGGISNSSIVMRLFKRMRAENNAPPDAHTFAGIFAAASNLADPFGGQLAHAVAVKMDICSDVFVGSSLMNMYCKSGFVSDARKVFDRMPNKNSFAWATMISGYALQRLAGEAIALFKLILWEGEGEGEVNEFVFTSVLSAFKLPELINIGKQIHCLVVKYGLLSVASVGNAVVTIFCLHFVLINADMEFEICSQLPMLWLLVNMLIFVAIIYCGLFNKDKRHYLAAGASGQHVQYQYFHGNREAILSSSR
ncbi:hypothetical protein RJ639_020898 [Escallonia herrerae]|uniref:Pentatricopeptide repeat-containing protein n=1 Tax=Escallonia herrerae TaxID=1293975 RepID=A0AA88V5P7_9ASTE|nr:hypothetical protein RJ639_020898 [Escallonia herrerae]